MQPSPIIITSTSVSQYNLEDNGVATMLIKKKKNRKAKISGTPSTIKAFA